MDLPFNKHLHEVLRLSNELMALSEKGEADAADDGCRVLYGIVRDCALRIRSGARSEREAHRKMGVWAESGGPEEEMKHRSVGLNRSV
jgi:hypothetical protein